MRKQAVIGVIAGAVVTAGLLGCTIGNWNPDHSVLVGGDERIQVSAYRGAEPGTAVLVIANRGPEPVAVDIVPGLVLVTDAVHSSDLVVAAPGPAVTIDDSDPRHELHSASGPPGEVAPGTRLMIEVRVLSLEHRRQVHVAGEPLAVSYVDPLLANLVETICRLAPDAPADLVQIALWAVTDAVTRDDMDHVRSLTTRELFDIRFWYEAAGLDQDRVELLRGLDSLRGNGGPAVMGELEVWVSLMRRVMDLAGTRADRGRQFLTVEVCMVNRGEPLEVFESDFGLRDAAGTEHDPSPLSGRLPRGFRTRVQVDPGSRYCGTLVFDIPLGAGGFTLRHGDDERYFEIRGDQ